MFRILLENYVDIILISVSPQFSKEYHAYCDQNILKPLYRHAFLIVGTAQNFRLDSNFDLSLELRSIVLYFSSVFYRVLCYGAVHFQSIDDLKPKSRLHLDSNCWRCHVVSGNLDLLLFSTVWYAPLQGSLWFGRHYVFPHLWRWSHSHNAAYVCNFVNWVLKWIPKNTLNCVEQKNHNFHL